MTCPGHQSTVDVGEVSMVNQSSKYNHRPHDDRLVDVVPVVNRPSKSDRWSDCWSPGRQPTKQVRHSLPHQGRCRATEQLQSSFRCVVLLHRLDRQPTEQVRSQFATPNELLSLSQSSTYQA